LIGTWTIKETLSDPGDGSGKWEPVSTGETLNFKSDGTISGTALGNIKSYKIIDSIRIQFIEANDNTYICRFLINDEYLEINPPCRERCGSRFKR
jgi:hypothetical protein